MHRAKAWRLIWLGALLLLGACERDQHLVEQHLLEFGTIIQVTMISDDLVRAESLLADIEQRLKRQRHQWHAWEDSELTRFNIALQSGERVEVPRSLAPLLQLSQEFHAASDGLFNPALGKLVAAYGFHGGGADAAEIARIRLDVPDMRDLRIVGGQASSSNPDLQIDLGGIAKGYAIGVIAGFLDDNGIHNYIVNAGGDLVTAGSRFGRPWRVGIRNPFAPGIVASIELEGSHALFTSGNYERSYRVGEALKHHIIDPRSGDSARGQSSATVLHSDPVRADVAATTLMIEGLDRHRQLSRSLQIENYLIISETREILLSRQLAERVHVIAKWPVKVVD